MDLRKMSRCLTASWKDIRSWGKNNGGSVFIDRGGHILSICHADISSLAGNRPPRIFADVNDPNTHMIVSGACDDRIGLYAIVYELRALRMDVLITDGEETCRSTAAKFKPPHDYNWIVEFDRRGDDVVLYDYDEKGWEAMIKSVGFDIGTGSFTDICELEHLGVMGMNIGVGYHNEHSPECTWYQEQFDAQIAMFRTFYKKYHDVRFPYTPVMGSRSRRWYRGGYSGYGYGVYDTWNDDPKWKVKSYRCKYCNQWLMKPSEQIRGICKGCDNKKVVLCKNLKCRTPLDDTEESVGECSVCQHGYRCSRCGGNITYWDDEIFMAHGLCRHCHRSKTASIAAINATCDVCDGIFPVNELTTTSYGQLCKGCYERSNRHTPATQCLYCGGIMDSKDQMEYHTIDGNGNPIIDLICRDCYDVIMEDEKPFMEGGH